MPGVNDKMVSDNTTPRQPTSLQGLLRLAMEATQAEATAGDAQLSQIDEERKRFLEEALKSMSIDVIEILQKQIKILQDADKLTIDDDITEYNTAFDSILDYIDNIDIANDFHKIGGFTIFTPCFNCIHAKLRANACDLLAELSQNNPYCQKVILDNGFVPLLLNILNKDNEDDTVCIKAVYAVSCITRQNQDGFNQLIQYGGLSTLLKMLKKNDDKIRTKVTFLLSALCRSQSDFKSRLIFLEYIPCLISLISEDRRPSHEHVLSLLLNLVEENPTAQMECKNPEHKLDEILKNYLASVRNKDECLEEEQYCRKLIRLLQYG